MEQNKMYISIIKGLTLSIISTLVLIFCFALAIKWFELSDNCIVYVNYGIKILSIFFGVILITRDKTQGLKKGFILGVLYVLLAFIIFSFLNKSFVFNVSILLDMLFGGLVGGIIGIVLVNFRKKN